MGGDAPEPAVAAPRLAGGLPPVPGAALGLVTERFKTANLEANELLEEAVLILPIIVAPAPRRATAMILGTPGGHGKAEHDADVLTIICCF